MPRGKKHTAEQIVSLLRQIEVAVANGKTTPVGCRDNGITEQMYYRWRKEYGGLVSATRTPCPTRLSGVDCSDCLVERREGTSTGRAATEGVG
jgi:hypothetical protein